MQILSLSTLRGNPPPAQLWLTLSSVEGIIIVIQWWMLDSVQVGFYEVWIWQCICRYDLFRYLVATLHGMYIALAILMSNSAAERSELSASGGRGGQAREGRDGTRISHNRVTVDRSQVECGVMQVASPLHMRHMRYTWLPTPGYRAIPRSTRRLAHQVYQHPGAGTFDARTTRLYIFEADCASMK